MSTLKPLSIKPESLTQMVYDVIREAIVSKDFAPGTPVSEAKLARELQVSKTPVREALLRLQSVGLIEPYGSRGVRVVSPSLERISQAYEIRGILESGAARLAAEHATEEAKLTILRSAAASLAAAESGDSAGFSKWDGIFHLDIAAATGSARLETLVENALSLTRVLRQRDVPATTDATKCGNQHVEIANAIAAGDSFVAAEKAIEHAHDVQRMVLNLADFDQSDSPAESV